jgi:RelB antitoxin
MMLVRVAAEKALPFEVKVPNAVTAKTLRKADRSKDLVRSKDAADLFGKLGSLRLPLTVRLVWKLLVAVVKPRTADTIVFFADLAISRAHCRGHGRFHVASVGAHASRREWLCSIDLARNRELRGTSVNSSTFGREHRRA